MSEMCYIGVSACGCIRAATVDNPAHAKEVRKDVTSFMRYGDTIERMTSEQVRVKFCIDKHIRSGKVQTCPHPGACPHRVKEPQKVEAKDA